MIQLIVILSVGFGHDYIPEVQCHKASSVIFMTPSWVEWITLYQYLTAVIPSAVNVKKKIFYYYGLEVRNARGKLNTLTILEAIIILYIKYYVLAGGSDGLVTGRLCDWTPELLRYSFVCWFLTCHSRKSTLVWKLDGYPINPSIQQRSNHNVPHIFIIKTGLYFK